MSRAARSHREATDRASGGGRRLGLLSSGLLSSGLLSIGLLSIGLVSLGLSAPARAQDAPASELRDAPPSGAEPDERVAFLDAARAAYESAELERVLELLARAEASEGLSRDDVVSLLVLRALTHHAMGATDAERLDLERVAYLAPNLPPPAELPPSMRRELERARARVEPLRLLGDIERSESGVRFAIRAAGDPRGLVRSLQAQCRDRDGAWRPGHGGVVQLDAADGELVACASTLVGPGGAVLLTRGTREAPLELEVQALEAADDGGDDLAIALAALGIGVVVAAAIAVTVGLLVAPPSTLLSAPEL